MEVFDLKKCQIEITDRLPEPDEQGTVATGWVIWEGRRYTYRAVMWDERQAAEANIRANKAGGDWDFDVMSANFEVKDLLDWGFSEHDLQLGDFDFGAGGKNNDAEPQLDKAAELLEVWGVKKGDLWGLGKFTVCPKCGKVHPLP